MHEPPAACGFPDKDKLVRRPCHLPSPKVSQAAAELQQYCMQNACKDALLVGVPAGSNPFREPRSCALL
ncbi:PREDICTED: guanine nucleotide-binding protein G(I)/G(S)/G(O) subunit gamma-10 [Haliaeetus leucocephalus]|uniref:guanine nucleotide-binding protein G(I)/G(S)/G(O) subunit gamma-10 n=1 Tax=Haliaeetus leucocephalus TaxID=52644 RepID=UPI00053CEAFF|nr:PREDICTED: guanine nucleotide-binding protein G(I)/G(S)/G(O) subunit gamma-10 [Haliaeetus leucocephalus]